MITTHMVFDVESIGLHGEGFAVGWVVFQFDDATGEGKPTHEGVLLAPPESAQGPIEGREWVEKHVPRELLDDFYLGAESIPANPEAPYTLKVKCDSPVQLRDQFWTEWRRHFEAPIKARLWADCLWPVEARFLAQCVDDDHSRDWDGPYPFYEVASVALAAGLADADSFYKAWTQQSERMWNELPEHHPLADARHSARQLCESLAILASKGREAR